MSTWNSLSCAETAKLVRAALKAAFPGVTFSVKSKTYSGGGSITVGWTDGPSGAEVAKITSQYEGADFDGMQDLKTYRYHAQLPDGSLVPYKREDGLPAGAKEVHLRADFIFTDRQYTREFLEKCAKRTADYWGITAPLVNITTYGAQYDRTWERIGGGTFTADELAQQLASKSSRVANCIVYPKR